MKSEKEDRQAKFRQCLIKVTTTLACGEKVADS
jgi:hypothetical protein